MRIRFLDNGQPVMVVPHGTDSDSDWGVPSEEIEHGTHGIGNVWLVRNHFPRAGQWAPGHHHPHDHLMLLTAGEIEIVANGLGSRYQAEHILIIPKQTRHQIRALQDNTTIWCVAALRDGETGEVIGTDDIVETYQPLTEELATALGALHVKPAAETS